jgi:hypothetical protein
VGFVKELNGEVVMEDHPGHRENCMDGSDAVKLETLT